MSKKRILYIVGGVVFVSILGLLFFCCKKCFSKEFGDDIFISGIDVSSLSVEDAVNELNHPKKFWASVKGKSEYKIDLSNCIRRQFSHNDVEECKNDITVWETLTGEEKNFSVIPEEVSFDDEKMKKVLRGSLPEGTVKTQDARFDEDFQLVKEVYGDELNLDALLERIKKDVKEGKNLNYILEDYQKKPKYTSDSKNIKKALKKIEKMKSTKITYTFGKASEVIGWDELKGHLKLNLDKVKLTPDSKWLKSYVKKMAQKHDTYGTVCKFKTTKGGTVKLRRSSYGWLTNQEKTVKQLKKLVKQSAVKKVEPHYISKGGSHDKKTVGNTYIEVSIPQQHVWVYKNGKKIMESDVVTGKMTRDRMTHTGIYQIYAKQRERYLGTIAVQGYHTLVHYWMPFNGGEGLHDATWRRKFGGTIYRGGGSHGCVNLPYSFAAGLYDKISVGTPVIVY